eukprot:4791518-Pleurochrysis_carterae.AAC.1
MSGPSPGLGDTPRLGAERWVARPPRLERATGGAETRKPPSSGDRAREQLSHEGPAQGRVETIPYGGLGQCTLRRSTGGLRHAGRQLGWGDGDERRWPAALGAKWGSAQVEVEVAWTAAPADGREGS